MKIQILGTGCAKCKKLTEQAETAAKELGVTIACDLQDVVRADDGYRRDFVELQAYSLS